MNKWQVTEIVELTNAFVNGTCTPEEEARLSKWLRCDEQARNVFLRYTQLHGQLSLIGELACVPLDDRTDILATSRPSQAASLPIAAAFAAAACVLLIASVGISFRVLRPMLDDDYDSRTVPVRTIAFLGNNDQSNPITTTTIMDRPDQTLLKTNSGTQLQVDAQGVFGLSSESIGVLYKGSVQARAEQPDAKYTIEAGNLRFVGLGNTFRVTSMDDQQVELDVFDGVVTVESRTRLPQLFWNFDEGNTSDVIGGLKGELGRETRLTKGLIGSGALAFNNKSEASFLIREGTAETVGDGVFAYSSGVTIEVMIVSHWSGDYRDYDEIFRKEDGEYRILLAFQHDEGRFDVPAVPRGPCLAFGLHLEGHGYSELDMPLDGRDGRPTLRQVTDGNPHHVVACYDSFTGEKAIYFDGVKCFSHHFGKGTMIRSGGPAPATIGNWNGREPLHGTIDEVAFYRIALQADEVAGHYRRVCQGLPYFDTWQMPRRIDNWQFVSQVTAGKKVRFNQPARTRIPSS